MRDVRLDQPAQHLALTLTVNVNKPHRRYRPTPDPRPPAPAIVNSYLDSWLLDY